MIVPRLRRTGSRGLPLNCEYSIILSCLFIYNENSVISFFITVLSNKNKI
jgi:hypothetical protein